MSTPLPQAASRFWSRDGTVSRFAVIVILAVLCVAMLYRETAVSMITTWWRSDTFAHGMVILPIFFYMVWEKRHRLHGAEIRPVFGTLLLLAVITGGWLLARLANVLVVQQFAVTAMVPTLVLLLAGGDVVRRMLFPLLYLFFMVPFGAALVPILQDITAVITVKGLLLSGIPVLQEGRFLTIPSGKFEVAEACSGVRYLIASLAVGSCYAYLCYRSPWRRWAFIGLAMLVPVLANGLRAFGIVMIAHLSDMRYAMGVDHVVYGWVFFGVVMFFLFWIGSFWHDDLGAGQDDHGEGPVLRGRDNFGTFALAAVAGILLIAAGPFLAGRLEGSGAEQPASTAPAVLPEHAWDREQDGHADWRPVFHGATAETVQVFSDAGREVTFYYAYYASEEQGRELINARNRIYDDNAWRRIGEESRDVVTGGESRTVREMLLRRADARLLVWYWYEVDGQVTANSWHAKLLGIVARLRGQPAGGAVFAVATPVDLRPEPARTALRDFLEGHWPSVRH